MAAVLLAGGAVERAAARPGQPGHEPEPGQGPLVLHGRCRSCWCTSTRPSGPWWSRSSASACSLALPALGGRGARPPAAGSARRAGPATRSSPAVVAAVATAGGGGGERAPAPRPALARPAIPPARPQRRCCRSPPWPLAAPRRGLALASPRGDPRSSRCRRPSPSRWPPSRCSPLVGVFLRGRAWRWGCRDRAARHRARRRPGAATSWGRLGKGLGILAAVELLAVVVAYLAPGRSGARARRRARRGRAGGRVHPRLGARLPGREVLPGAPRRRRLPRPLLEVHAPRVHGAVEREAAGLPLPVPRLDASTSGGTCSRRRPPAPSTSSRW